MKTQKIHTVTCLTSLHNGSGEEVMFWKPGVAILPSLYVLQSQREECCVVGKILNSSKKCLTYFCFSDKTRYISEIKNIDMFCFSLKLSNKDFLYKYFSDFLREKSSQTELLTTYERNYTFPEILKCFNAKNYPLTTFPCPKKLVKNIFLPVQWMLFHYYNQYFHYAEKLSCYAFLQWLPKVNVFQV